MEFHCGTVLGKHFDLVSCATLLSEQSHCSFEHKTDPVGRATSNWKKNPYPQEWPVMALFSRHHKMRSTSQDTNFGIAKFFGLKTVCSPHV